MSRVWNAVARGDAGMERWLQLERLVHPPSSTGLCRLRRRGRKRGVAPGYGEFGLRPKMWVMTRAPPQERNSCAANEIRGVTAHVLPIEDVHHLQLPHRRLTELPQGHVDPSLAVSPS